MAAKISALSISGIRSFNPDEEELLEIKYPLTLIVGHNGAGKTTIIECLKYATTGELPPNSRNGAFVCDPKVVQQAQVKGKVSLNFTDINGRPMSCTRILAVTQTARSRTMKTIDTHLKFRRGFSANGKTQYVSRKVAEVDTMIPLHMGVSKAILENVIFCHQEDSLWPLSEPGTLKKKFDEIFEATRYAKALDNIKALRKDQVSQLKVHQANLEHLKVLKEKATRVRKDRLNTHDKITEIKTRSTELDTEIEHVKRSSSAFMEKRAEASALEAKVRQLKVEQEMIIKQAEELHSEGNLFYDSEEVLRRMKDEQMVSLSERDHEVALLERQRTDLLRQQDSIRASISEQLTLLGKVSAEKEAYTRALHDLELLFDDLRVQNFLWKIADTDEFWNTDNFDRILQEFGYAVEEKSVELSELKKKNRHVQQNQQDAVQTLQTSLTNAKEIKRMSQMRFDECDRKMTSLNSQLTQTRVTESDVRVKREELEREQKALEDLNIRSGSQSGSGTGSAGFLEENEEEAELSRLLEEEEKRMTTLSGEMSLLNKQLDARTRLDMLQDNISAKKLVFDGLVANIIEQIGITVGPVSSWSNTISRLHSLHKEKKELHQKAVVRLQGKQSETSGLESQLNLLKKQLAEKQAWITRTIPEIHSVTNGEEYKSCLERENAEVGRLSTALSAMKSAITMYRKFIHDCQSYKCCPLCERGFPNANEEAEFLQRLQDIIDRVPTATHQTEEEFNLAEKRKEALSKIQFKVSQLENIQSKEIPALQNQMETIQQSLRTNAVVVENASTEAALLEGEVQDLEALLAEVTAILKVEAEIKPLDVEISGLKRQLSQTSSQGTKSLSAVREEYEKCQAECQRIRKELNVIHEQQKQQQQLIQTHYANIQRIQTQLHHLQSEMTRKKALEKELVEEQGKRIQLEVELHHAESDEAALLPQLQKQQREFMLMQNECAQKENEIETVIQRLQKAITALQTSERSLQHFKNARLEERENEHERQKSHFETQLGQATTSIETLRAKIDQHQQQTSQVQLNLRRIEDSFKYKQLLQRRAQIDINVGEAEEQTRKMNVDSLDREQKTLRRRYDALMGEQAGLVGELKQLEVQHKRLEHELDTDYKDIDSRFAEQMIVTTTEQMANEDLEQYRAALDRAIMKYHSLKMQEINDIVRRLWHSTYSGGDIDTIEIRSDDDGAQASGNRSYNYRVVMLKDNCELDMRGRCSAGQKVLTSIIIRLALQETFCSNFSILALDEPTTNLDRDNIEGLARALGKIIHERREQSNFQLIVITHDEEFVELLGRSEYCDSFYRVSKDASSFSQITECPIAYTAA